MQMLLRLNCECVYLGWRLMVAQSFRCVVSGEWRGGNRGCSETSYALWQALIACGSCCVFGFV